MDLNNFSLAKWPPLLSVTWLRQCIKHSLLLLVISTDLILGLYDNNDKLIIKIIMIR